MNPPPSASPLVSGTRQPWFLIEVEGIEGREEGQQELLCRQTARKFDGTAAERLAAILEDAAEPERLAQVGHGVIKCETADDLFARLHDGL